MKRILILFAHPVFEKSKVNKLLVQGLDQIDGLTVNDLYQEYPELYIDVAREQKLLTQHDVVIFQHPFYWYSTPAILKEWQDLVLEHGWAYGKDGNALEGKIFMNIISTGGKEEAYCSKGYNHFTIRQLLAPLEQTATLCKMQFLPPFIIHGTHKIEMDVLLDHKDDLISLLMALRDERLDLERAKKLNRINLDLSSLLLTPA